MRGHAHCHQGRLYARVGAERRDVTVGALDAVLLGCVLCRVRVCRAKRIEFGLGQPRKGRHMGPRSPSSFRSDQAYTQPFAHCHGFTSCKKEFDRAL